MHNLFFWKNWLTEYRRVWYVSAGLFGFALLFLWFAYFQEPKGVLHWEKIQEQKPIETIVHSFRLGPFALNIPAESYIIFDYFQGSTVSPNTVASYLFLIILTAAAIIILTSITTIERFWFFVAMALFILFVVSLRLEVLGLFDLSGRFATATALLLYVLPAFYFNRFRPATPFVVRLFVFTLITVVFAGIIQFYSTVQYPFLHLTLTSYTAGLVLSILFIIIVAHEILATFVSIAQGTTKSLRHLSLICVVYLANLLITCLHEVGAIEWNFVYINLYLLLTVSAILGIWEFRNREPVYGNILSFYPFGAYFFLGMGAICFATIAQLLGNTNDPALKIIRDAIIFSHTGYGLIFTTYLFSNFVLMLARNLPVHKVLYNPTRMPYFTYRFAGLIVMLAFAFYSNWREYVYHGLAGFYNNAGDLYNLLENDVYAESFYEQGSRQGFQNHRSNYALGVIRASRYSFEAAHNHYTAANAKRPTEYSLTNAGNLYLWENNAFDAIHTYRHALRRLPNSGVLANNLGFAYSKIHHTDSTLFFLNEARAHNLSRSAAETNFFAFATQEFLPLNADSVVQVFNTGNPATLSNALALSTLFGEPFETKVSPLSDKKLNLYTATLLNNYIIKHAKALDTVFINQAYTIASDSINTDFGEALKASLAFAYYHQNNIAKALQILGELAYLSQSHQGKFNYTMGLWALEQNNPEVAASYFSYADTYDYKQARFYHAIALTEAGKVTEALMAWDTVAAGQDDNERAVAARMQTVLTVPLTDVFALPDAEKYQFCRYRLSLRDTLSFNRIIDTFENVNYKAQALLDISRRYFETDQLIPAIRYYNRIAGLALTDKNLYEEVRHFELLMLAYRGEIRMLASQINKGITFPSASLEKMLYTALISHASGDTAVARQNYSILGRYNPYFEEGIIAAAKFFKGSPQNLQSYNILAEAIQVNANSIRLLKAYMEEAARLGFDVYARSAAERLAILQNQN